MTDEHTKAARDGVVTVLDADLAADLTLIGGRVNKRHFMRCAFDERVWDGVTYEDGVPMTVATHRDDCAECRERAEAVDALARVAVRLDQLETIRVKAEEVADEIRADAKLKCLLCYERDGEHVDGCIVPEFLAALAVVSRERTEEQT